MTREPYRIVGRMQGIRPEKIDRYEMHRRRTGGELDHVDPSRSRLNRVLIGNDDWANETLARIDDIRTGNHIRRMQSLERRKRKKDLMEAIVEGPSDPWRPTKVGPMRELILTANKRFFEPDPDALFSGKPQPDRRFEALAVAWLKATFGEAVIHARADHDEAAYHIHAVIMPLAVKKDGRTMLEPSSHPLIKDYEKLQDALGATFADIGVARGERRAEAIRQAKARIKAGEEIGVPAPRRHVPTHEWREAEMVRLTGQAKAQDRIAAEQARIADELTATESRQRHENARLKAERTAVQEAELRFAAERAEAKERQRAAQAEGRAASQENTRRDLEIAARATALERQRAALAHQAAEQDAFAASAEAVVAGIINPAQPATQIAPRTGPERAIAARMNKSPAGLQRLLDTITPAWMRMREQARSEADAEIKRERDQVSRERAEIDTAWMRLRDIAVRLDPTAAGRTAREAIDRVIAKWRALRDRSPNHRSSGRGEQE